MPTPSVLPTISSLPVVVVGKVVVSMLPVKGLPLVGFNGSTHVSTSVRSEGWVMVLPAEFLIAIVKPVSTFEMTVCRVIGTVIDSTLSPVEVVTPPPVKAQATVSAAKPEPATNLVAVVSTPTDFPSIVIVA